MRACVRARKGGHVRSTFLAKNELLLNGRGCSPDKPPDINHRFELPDINHRLELPDINHRLELLDINHRPAWNTIHFCFTIRRFTPFVHPVCPFAIIKSRRLLLRKNRC